MIGRKIITLMVYAISSSMPLSEEYYDINSVEKFMLFASITH